METESVMRAGEGNTAIANGATPNTLEANLREGRWERMIDIAILLLAAFLRLAWLEIKPLHFDEGVNGWFADQMTSTGYYHYEPANFHGPLHFYILFLAQTLFGREVWVLRIPLALASLGAVAFALFGWRRFFSAGTCRLAALALAVSPAMVFYGRYAIHETWLVLFQMFTVCGLARLAQEHSRSGLWLAGMGMTGMILTKETWIIHATAIVLAALTLRGLEVFSRSAELPGAPGNSNRPEARASWDELARVAATSVGLIIFFYSGCLLDPTGLRGLGESFTAWIGTGMTGESGHEKPWWYWSALLATYEWPALIGLVASAGLLCPRSNRLARYFAILGAGTLVAYSLIDYKTPWCLISLIWPFFFVFAAAVRRAFALWDASTFGAAAAVVLLCSLLNCATLNFRNYAGSETQPDEAEPYVYVQTRRDLNALLDPLRWLARRDPLAAHRRGHILQPDHHPLLWLLGDFTHLTWADDNGVPETMDADWLLVDMLAVDRVEAELRGEYFRAVLQLRGMAPDRSVLYLRAGTFRDFFPGREPEFLPNEALLSREREPAR